jgi:glc operon protein GlcG
MTFRILAIVMTCMTLLAAPAFAQATAPVPAPASPPPAPPAYGPPVTIDQAKKVVAAAVAEAKKTAYLYTFAVVDPAGDLVYFEKMDSAPTSSNEVGIGKARTAAIFKRPSKAFFDQMESGHPFVGQLDPRIVASAGGIPLIVDGKIVGAIGISGGANGLMDAVAAQAGADALH